MKNNLIKLFLLSFFSVFLLSSCQNLESLSINRYTHYAEFVLEDGVFVDKSGTKTTSYRCFYMLDSKIQDPIEDLGYKVVNEGYVFEGWYLENATEPWRFEKDVLVENTVLYGRWVAANRSVSIPTFCF